MDKEIIEKLNTLEEDVTPENTSEFLDWKIEGTVFKGLLIKDKIKIVIPEGITALDGGFNWRLTSSLGYGNYLTQIEEIVFPSTLTSIQWCNWFPLQYPFNVKLTFKGDVSPFIENIRNGVTREYWIERLLKAKNKQQILEKFIANQFGIAYGRVTFDFEVEPNFDHYEIDEIDFANL